MENRYKGKQKLKIASEIANSILLALSLADKVQPRNLI